MPSPDDVPKFHVDFNELLEFDLVLLSRSDSKATVDGTVVEIREGLAIAVTDEDLADDGTRDDLIAFGVAELNRDQGSTKHVKWCCRIGPDGIQHESDLAAKRH